MKHIVKEPSPTAFERWKRQNRNANYCDLEGELKKNVKDALISEQHYICCYCEVRINQVTSHIEHLKPQATNAQFALDYKNFLASCNGGIQSQRHCGPKKDRLYDDILMVSPLIPNCAEYFEFDYDGGIHPSHDPQKTDASKWTIATLGLDVNRLCGMRRQAIEGLPLYDTDITAAEICNLISDFSQPDENGKLVPFYSTIIYILNDMLADLQSLEER